MPHLREVLESQMRGLQAMHQAEQKNLEGMVQAWRSNEPISGKRRHRAAHYAVLTFIFEVYAIRCQTYNRQLDQLRATLGITTALVPYKEPDNHGKSL